MSGQVQARGKKRDCTSPALGLVRSRHGEIKRKGVKATHTLGKGLTG